MMMMERILLGVLYLSGWLFSSSSCLPRQYHYVAGPMKWTEAQTYCRETYTDLATIENTEEMNQLINTVSSSGYNSDVWIGLKAQINWTWSDGYRGSGAEYRNWEINEPDYYSATYHCVLMYRGSGKWGDDRCKDGIHFICNNGTQQDPKFVLVKEDLSWSSAQRYCRENSRDLATVRNSAENQEIQNLMGSASWVWIGLFSELHIYWSDGSNSTFTYWDGSSIPYGSTSVLCGVADLQTSGKWKVSDCDTRFPFVCHSVPSTPAAQTTSVSSRPLVTEGDINSSKQPLTTRNKEERTSFSGTQMTSVSSRPLVTEDDINSSRQPQTTKDKEERTSFSATQTTSVSSGSLVIEGDINPPKQPQTTRDKEKRTSFSAPPPPPPPPPPVSRQIVKMKIKWEGSGDINDPAVKAAILKQLQDKVKDKGMNGVTLKWREQPDGKVFHKEKKKRRIKTEL